MQFTSILGLMRSLPEVGRIKIGEPGEVCVSQTGKKFRLPKKLDHFKVVTRFRGADGRFMPDEEVHKVLGEHPREIDVVLMYDDPRLNSPHRLSCYSGSARYCSGNGEQALRLDPDTGTYNPRSCPCALFVKPEVAEENKGKGENQMMRCKPYGVFRVQLPVKKSSVGCYAFRTTSSESLSNIVSMQEEILLRTGGILAGIQLKIKMYPASETTPAGATTNWKVYLDLPEGGWDEVIRQAQESMHRRLTTRIDMKAIEATHRLQLEKVLSDPQAAEEVLAELFPEQAAIAAGVEIEGEVVRSRHAGIESEGPGTGDVFDVASLPPRPKTDPPAEEPKPEPPKSTTTPKPEPPKVDPPKSVASAEPTLPGIADDTPGDATPVDPEEVKFMESEGNAEKEIASLRTLADRKGFPVTRTTKPVEQMDEFERKSFLRFLLAKPDKKGK